MSVSQNYRDLRAWNRAMDLVERLYALSASFPLDERYGLTSQVRRAAVSVPSNIAEGQGRRSLNEFIHHLSIAHGSLREVETQCLIGARLGYVNEGESDDLLALASEVGRLLNALMNALEARR
jgi:four helix bundle protein